MGTAIFYHLTRSAAEDTLLALLPRALAQGWRVMIRHPDRAAIEALDHKLWLGPDGGFMPHGVAGGTFDADQPVLLGQGAAVNTALGLFLLGGAAPLPGEEALERIWLLFDGGDEAAVAAARGHWSGLTAKGMAAQYWSEEDGRWQKKAEKLVG
jgi:DNA polymerase-3 subunit chi